MQQKKQTVSISKKARLTPVIITPINSFKVICANAQEINYHNGCFIGKLTQESYDELHKKTNTSNRHSTYISIMDEADLWVESDRRARPRTDLSYQTELRLARLTDMLPLNPRLKK